MPTARKRETVKEIQGLMTKSQVLIFTDYRGLSVADITNLRRQLREKGAEYHVTKNSLTTLAAGRAGLQGLDQMLDGPTAIAFVGEDIPGGARVLQDFVRTSRIMTIRGGMAGHALLSVDQVGDLTKILTREQYLSKVLGAMNSPVTSLVNVLAGTVRSFMNVMQALIDQRGGVETADTADAADTVEASPAEGASADGAPAPEMSMANGAADSVAHLAANEEAPAPAMSTSADATESASPVAANEEAPAPTMSTANRTTEHVGEALAPEMSRTADVTDGVASEAANEEAPAPEMATGATENTSEASAPEMSTPGDATPEAAGMDAAPISEAATEAEEAPTQATATTEDSTDIDGTEGATPSETAKEAGEA
ncbi:MAG: 50S ribosomal protein L10 [Chloroflexota bacterium]|nr:50S ribosomal protein L10 [Chloroflexota bacterium]